MPAFFPKVFPRSPEFRSMKSWLTRLSASAALAALCWLLLAGAATTKPAAVLEPGKLIILSTTDVKGKTSPCG